MYPTLTYVGNGSQWYLKEKSAQQKLLELTLLEERIQEQKARQVQVRATILIRGQPVEQQEVEEEEEEEEGLRAREEEVDGHPSSELHDDMMIDPFQ